MSTVYTGQSSLIESGLFLPLRFYDSIDQQERYKPLSEGVANNVSYVYVDSLSLIPFQIHTEGYIISLHAICVDTGEEIDLPNIETATDSEGGSGLQMTLYHGDATDVALLPNALYYLKLVCSNQNDVKTFTFDGKTYINDNNIYTTSNLPLPSDVNDMIGGVFSGNPNIPNGTTVVSPLIISNINPHPLGGFEMSANATANDNSHSTTITYTVTEQNVYYSDIFKTLPDDPGSNFVKIKYKNTVAVGDIEYDDFATSSYTNWCWLDADIHKPTYPIRRESKENDRGDIRHSFQRWDKVYTMEIWVNEVMADFLSLIPLHDTIEITFNGFTATCYDFAFDPKWESISSVALATITFSTKSVILSGYKGTC